MERLLNDYRTAPLDLRRGSFSSKAFPTAPSVLDLPCGAHLGPTPPCEMGADPDTDARRAEAGAEAGVGGPQWPHGLVPEGMPCLCL